MKQTQVLWDCKWRLSALAYPFQAIEPCRPGIATCENSAVGNHQELLVSRITWPHRQSRFVRISRFCKICPIGSHDVRCFAVLVGEGTGGLGAERPEDEFDFRPGSRLAPRISLRPIREAVPVGRRIPRGMRTSDETGG